MHTMLAMYAQGTHHQHEEASVSVTQIDLDDEALADVMRIAGVHTKKEAVNLAMRDYVERFRRVEALARSREQAKGWDYDGWLAARADEKAVGT
jgi:Arc/MetJ family transcription regulator